MNTRFTAWLSDYERTLLDAKARQLGTSRNYLVRMAIRKFLGLDTPPEEEAVSQMSHVTSDK